jgi:hypothetical protein
LLSFLHHLIRHQICRYLPQFWFLRLFHSYSYDIHILTYAYFAWPYCLILHDSVVGILSVVGCCEEMRYIILYVISCLKTKSAKFQLNSLFIVKLCILSI